MRIFTEYLLLQGQIGLPGLQGPPGDYGPVGPEGPVGRGGRKGEPGYSGTTGPKGLRVPYVVFVAHLWSKSECCNKFIKPAVTDYCSKTNSFVCLFTYLHILF